MRLQRRRPARLHAFPRERRELFRERQSLTREQQTTLRPEEGDECLRGFGRDLQAFRGVVPLRQLASMQSRARPLGAFAAEFEDLRQFQRRFGAVAAAEIAAADGILDAQMHRGINPKPRLNTPRFRDADILREDRKIGMMHEREGNRPDST